MNIVFLVSSLEGTGPGVVVENLANQFVKKHDVSIIAISESEKVIKVHPKIRVLEMNLPHSRLSQSSEDKIVTMIKKINPDILFSHGLRADLINSRKSLSVYKKVSTSHNNPFEDYVAQYGIIKGFFMAILQIRTFAKLDKVVTLNPELELLHKKFLGKKKVTLIANGVKPINVQRTTGNQIRFGTVATLNKRKRPEYILKNIPNRTILKMFGSGEHLSDMCKKYRNSYIDFLGYSTDKNYIFSSFDVLISASKSEGMPMSVLEAISTGMPLILSDIPAHRFITSFLPKNSFRIFRNKKSFIDAIKFFSNSHNVQQAKAPMLESYENYFSERKMADAYLNLFETLNMEK
ncbi:glycosyltransferase [Weissella soli]|uniref:glycosyltransferase n=1 Tax=Weissella soli TaxID=155866 RepID=UPI001F3C276C|nr:glycosyltransferase [Weissella soli]GJM47738.1 glycosyl transferase [Weissella soli]